MIDAYGRKITGFTGAVRPVAYVPLDQGDNVIIGNGIKVSEYVWTKSGEEPDTTENIPQPKDGVYIDIQMAPQGTPLTTLKQKVYVDQYSSGGLARSYVCEVDIVKNVAAKTISVERQKPRRSTY